jgi:phosphoribosylaminoimidazole-succinocarboxamide synthase
MTLQTTYLGRERRIPGVQWLASGKVRDIYAIDAERLLFVTSDRVSAFDVVMNEGIPHKGEVLTAIAAYWFETTRDVIENHLISTSVDDVPALPPEWRDRLRGRVMVVRRAQPTTVEWVVRGYLAGSGWKEYQKQQSVCGVALPAGLSNSSKLPQPILTPTTKEESGHDLPITPDQARERVGAGVFDAAVAAQTGGGTSSRCHETQTRKAREHKKQKKKSPFSFLGKNVGLLRACVWVGALCARPSP